MKLKKILPYIWFMEDVRIILADDKNEEAFTGSILNVPYWLGEYYLLNKEYEEAISIDDSNKEKRPILEIIVTKDKHYKIEDNEDER